MNCMLNPTKLGFELRNTVKKGLSSTRLGLRMNQLFNQTNLFIKPFEHQPMSQSAIQKPSLKPQKASYADVEALLLGTWRGKQQDRTEAVAMET